MKKAVAILDENAWTLRHMDGSTMAVGSSGLDTARRMTVSQALKSKVTTESQGSLCLASQLLVIFH